MAHKKYPLIVINDSIFKYWTDVQFRDSVRWSDVKSVNELTDTLLIYKNFGIRNKDRVIIIQYKEGKKP